MLRKLGHKLEASYRKNKDDVGALLSRRYPRFVYRGFRALPRGEIPVFTFHTVEPERFKAQLEYLAENGYQTLDADELAAVMRGEREPRDGDVVLTFDDGRGSLWSVAHPLLAGYGMRGIAFIVTGAVPEGEPRPTLKEVWAGTAELEEVIKREDEAPLCTWDELKAMHQAGTVDCQSHTMYHNSLWVSDELVDFVNPEFEPSFLCSTFNPVLYTAAGDVCLQRPQWGQPVYRFDAYMRSSMRYIEDEGITAGCVAFVREQGSEAFFSRPDWRRRLEGRLRELRCERGERGRFVSAEERFDEMQRDLVQSREMLEERLENQVRHLCYPWYLGSQLAVRASKLAGYQTNHWGILDREVICRPGDDPYFIPRLNDDYVFSLPGSGRKTLPGLLLDKTRRILSR